jgi:3',5'-cyclic AMP phosphodiesterase CpdA
MAVAHAELLSVGTDEVVVTFTSEPGERAVTRVGDHEVTTTGPFHHAAVRGLAPDTEYAIAVEGDEPDGRWLPAVARTLAQPHGRLLATIGTANDVHFGETECGKTGDPAVDAIGPVLSSAPGEPPYPEMMGSAVVDDLLALDPDVVVVKGDLTDSGRDEEYAAFLASYGRLGERMQHVRGNHDAMRDPNLARNDTPFAVDVNGVTLVVLDTVVPGRCGGALDATQRDFVHEVAGATSGPVLLFAHHPLTHWDTDYCIDPPDGDALVEVLARHPNVVASFAGHTHTNRLVRDERVPEVKFSETNCGKDFPGAWAEIRVYEGGLTQVLRRVQRPDAVTWAERARHMLQGYYRDLVFGDITDRAFTREW